jgi:NTE family protein
MSSAVRNSRPQVGLVLGSGGSRGIVHLEILDGLERLGVPLDLIIGSSIGAVAAGLYAVGAVPRVREDLRTIKREDFLRMFDPSLSRYGFFSGRKVLLYLRRYIPEGISIEDLPHRLGIVAADYETGRPVVFRKGNLLRAIRASISIPGVFTPVRMGGKLLLDGGVVSPLPVDIAEESGAHLVIAVSLQPAIGQLRRLLPFGRKKSRAGSSSESGSRPLVEKVVRRFSTARKEESGWWKIADQWLAAKRSEAEDRKKLPNLIDIITRTIDIMAYTETLQMLASHPPTVLFEFDFPELGTLDFTRSEELLAEGRRLLEAKKTEIRTKILDRLSIPVPPEF